QRRGRDHRRRFGAGGPRPRPRGGLPPQRQPPRDRGGRPGLSPPDLPPPRRGAAPGRRGDGGGGSRAGGGRAPAAPGRGVRAARVIVTTRNPRSIRTELRFAATFAWTLVAGGVFAALSWALLL